MKINGLYETIFETLKEEKYSISFDLNKIPTEYTLPEGIITMAGNINGYPHIKLLKPYGPEEENFLHITFPNKFEILNDCTEKELKLSTSLTEFEVFIRTWENQLSEIKSQIHNTLAILKEEYSKINKIPPASPITIRSLKTTILTNTIMYIELISNFMMETHKKIKNKLEGAPKKTRYAPQKIQPINKKDDNSLGKIKYSLSAIKSLTDINIQFPDDNTPEIINFSNLKIIRNNITHIKNPNKNPHSLDSTPASVKITDENIVQCIESILFFNEFLSNAIEATTTKQHKKINDFICSTMYLLACEISGCEINQDIKNKYLMDIQHIPI